MRQLLPPLCVALLVLAGCDRMKAGSTAPDPTQIPAQSTLASVPLGAPPGQPIETASIQNPYKDDPAAVQEGKALFGAMNCVYCHGAEASGLMGPSLNGPGWRYGGSPAQIYNSIHDGRPKGMPAWGSRLPPDQIWKLVAYVESLSASAQPSTTGDEPADQVQSDTAHQALVASKTSGH